MVEQVVRNRLTVNGHDGQHLRRDDERPQPVLGPKNWESHGRKLPLEPGEAIETRGMLSAAL